ncbi:hypothetical protein [Enterococcus sp.]|uniref:hypothetical protein n=1 Tax=Enterococcus sp. TaxID=35783 RepID=UPI003C75B9A7
MNLNSSHYTLKFMEHIDWIIECLESDKNKTGYLEKEWFDEPVMIDLDLAKKIKGAIKAPE